MATEKNEFQTLVDTAHALSVELELEKQKRERAEQERDVLARALRVAQGEEGLDPNDSKTSLRALLMESRNRVELGHEVADILRKLPT